MLKPEILRHLSKKKTGNAVQTKDKNKFKHHLARKKEGGVSMGNTLKKMTGNKKTATVVSVDESDHVDLIYI